MNTFRNLVLKSRSVRRFVERHRIPKTVLLQWVDLARMTPSGGNRQVLKYLPVFDPKRNAAVFSCLGWAGYLTGWKGPAEGERPAAYILVLCDTALAKDPGHDAGIAAQTIMLAAAEQGLAGCMIGSVDRPRLREYLDIPATFDIVLVLALGKSAETVVLERVKKGDIKYWRDAQGVHHVPKRALKEVLVNVPVSAGG